ncbi:hypothetical protein Ciccas_006727 [Cichlidogyrus casuarinus]|uniref:Uncharacterized protein n=1 Tax=Cichlidogyrus casuarinus TaxID=1844966 RepID=A0ABD2Q5I8_9PLAT
MFEKEAKDSEIVNPRISRFKQLPTIEDLKVEITKTTVKMQESFMDTQKSTKSIPEREDSPLVKDFPLDLDDDNEEREENDELFDYFEQNGRKYRQKFDRKRKIKNIVSKEVLTISPDQIKTNTDDDRPILTVGVVRNIVEENAVPILRVLGGPSPDKALSETPDTLSPVSRSPSPVANTSTIKEQESWKDRFRRLICVAKLNKMRHDNNNSTQVDQGQHVKVSQKNSEIPMLRHAYQFGTSYDTSVLEPALDDSILHETLLNPAKSEQSGNIAAVDLAQWFVCSDGLEDGNVSLACMQNLYQASANGGRPLQRTTYVQQSIKMKSQL